MTCDCDGPRTHRVTVPRARKPHRCCECTQTIQPGERHEHVRGLWDAGWMTFRTCATCLALRADVLKRLPTWEPPPCYGELLGCADDMGIPSMERAMWEANR